MSNLLAIAASLKATLSAASFALARGDMLSVVLISVLFNLTHLGAKPSSERVQRDSMINDGLIYSTESKERRAPRRTSWMGCGSAATSRSAKGEA